MDYLQRDFCVMSVDDVWGAETWRMNQSELDVEPGSTKDKKSIMAKKRERGRERKSPVSLREKVTSSYKCRVSHDSSNTDGKLTTHRCTRHATFTLPDNSSSGGLSDVASLWEMM